MEFKILANFEQDKYDNEILTMLNQGDSEFVPPLSARSSTTQSDLTGTATSHDGVLNYFKELKKQKILVAVENEKLVAFVSYKENYTNDIIDTACVPNIYISTLLVAPYGRGQGLTRKMYEFLFNEYKNANVFTRTWSTNEAHIKILLGFGFETIKVLKNDRGNGIDTVYFKKCPHQKGV